MSHQENDIIGESLEIVPLVGIGCIRLGDSDDQVRRQLAANHIRFDDSHDPYSWVLDDPNCTLTFENGITKRLVQIDFSNRPVRIQGLSIVGLMLDEALLHLGVKSVEDTLWSIVDLDSEYTSGVAIPNKKRPTKCDVNALMDGGTLWIKSLGLALSVRVGIVESIAMRLQEDVPKVGCGPLNSVSMTAVTDPKLEQNILRDRNRLSKRVKRKSGPSILRRIVFSCLAVALVAIPVYFLIEGLQSWNNANEVLGHVVQTKPEGPFPDDIVVRYTLPDDTSKQVTIPSSYTTAREIGDEVELIYLPRDTSRAMTRLQARDDIWKVSPYLLFGSLAAATFSLRYAFPEYIRLTRKRPLNN